MDTQNIKNPTSMSAATDRQIVLVPVSDLKPHPRNARKHSRAQIKAIAKSIDVLSRQDACAIELAGMRMQGAATDLACRRIRLTSICFQHSRRGCIDSLKQTLGDAGFEEQRRGTSRLFRPVRGHPARISNARRFTRAIQQS